MIQARECRRSSFVGIVDTSDEGSDKLWSFCHGNLVKLAFPIKLPAKGDGEREGDTERDRGGKKALFKQLVKVNFSSSKAITKVPAVVTSQPLSSGFEIQNHCTSATLVNQVTCSVSRQLFLCSDTYHAKTVVSMRSEEAKKKASKRKLTMNSFHIAKVQAEKACERNVKAEKAAEYTK